MENHETYDIEIKSVRLDSIMDLKQTFRLLKLDIEEYKYQELIGASKLLEKGNIEHIIFEGTKAVESKAKKLLKSYNYTLFKITKTLYSVKLEDINCLARENIYEPNNCLATLNEPLLKQRLYKKGRKILHA